MQSLQLDAASLARLASIRTTCAVDDLSEEQRELVARFYVHDFASVTVFLVEAIDNPRAPLTKVTVGCATSDIARRAVLLSSLADPITLAHELGHLLLGRTWPQHVRLFDNVMREPPQNTSPSSWRLDPGLDSNQLVTMRGSPLLLRC
jgi:hypothetical protein